MMQSISIFFLCLCLCLCLGIIKVSCIDTLKQGETLKSSSQLDSPNGLFTLRFYTVEETNVTYIAILFSQISTSNVSRNGSLPVWIGNRGEPLPHGSTPSLALGARGELTITRRDGGDPVHLYSGGSQLGNNVTAKLSDTGNLVVQSTEVVLWQSYDHPTDTFLPGMKLGGTSKLTSWLSPSDPAPGAFTLEWDVPSAQLIIKVRGKAYWRSGQLIPDDDDDGISGNIEHLETSKSNSNSLLINPFTPDYNLSSEGEGEYLTYAVASSRNMGSGWKVEWTGDMSTIDGNGEDNMIMAMSSVCREINGAARNSRGCKVWGQCRNRSQDYDPWSGEFVDAAGGALVMPATDPDRTLALPHCRETCRSNCECAGYANLLGQDHGCSYWIGKDLVWRQLLNSRIKIHVLQTPSNKKDTGIVLGVTIPVALLLMLGLFCSIKQALEARREKQLNRLLTHEGYDIENKGANTHHLKVFTYASILSATNDFSKRNKLGQGGFGPVYKGTTTQGQNIAVKLLSRHSGQGMVEFKNELILISELQHVNLVKLIGFCLHKDDKMIIYDYMPNKSLDCFLSDPSKREQLDWKKRFNIIEGTAQGLIYLHKHSRLKIIHRDMKPNNILLDENMIPKISDFGLARIFKEDGSEVNTKSRVGTYGYMAPEYAMQGIFSVKSDVYSFGVLVLEIVSGRRNSSFRETEGPLGIVECAWELWRKDSALQLIDPMLMDSCIIEQMQKCIQIGLLCVENQAVDRPTIEDVLSMLKNETVTLPMPSNPGFITRNSVVNQVEKSSTSSNEVIKSSTNKITVSELDGR